MDLLSVDSKHKVEKYDPTHHYNELQHLFHLINLEQLTWHLQLLNINNRTNLFMHKAYRNFIHFIIYSLSSNCKNL